VDIEEACRVYENDWTSISIGDQADRGFWKRFKQEHPRIDVLIDDGGHQPEQQLATLEEMLPICGRRRFISARTYMGNATASTLTCMA